MSISKPLKWGLLSAVLLTLLALAAWLGHNRLQQNSESEMPKTNSLNLKFLAYFEAEPLVFNQFKYAEFGGEANGGGKFKIRDLQFFISNIKLIGNNETYVEADSYHLVRFDNMEEYFQILIDKVNIKQFHTLELSIGLDEKANASIKSIGDLNPNSRMAWSWEVGYKFIMFEGMLARGDKVIPLVYHVGFNENRKVIQLALNHKSISDQDNTVAIKVDVARLFRGKNIWNMADIPSVKFHKEDAKEFANNYADMLSVMP